MGFAPAQRALTARRIRLVNKTLVLVSYSNYLEPMPAMDGNVVTAWEFERRVRVMFRRSTMYRQIVDRGLFDNGQALKRRHTISLLCGALTVAWAIVLIG